MWKIAFTLILLVSAAFADEEVILRPRLDGRIVGGTPGTITQFPYIVSLRVVNSHICGASIISTQWIVTAAHCTISYSASLLSIRSGSALSNSGGTITNVAQVINHPNYNSRTIDNDISLLRLSAALSFSTSRQAIGLIAAGRELSAGTYATVSGWGTTREGGSASTQLLRVDVPIVSHASCNSAYGGITSSMLCAGYTAGGRDACQGDSGGPLVSGGVLVGVVSWGNGCARPNFPGVYAKVSHLRSFISSNTGI